MLPIDWRWQLDAVSGSQQIYVSFSVFTWLSNVIGFHTHRRTPYQTTEKHFSFHRSIAVLKSQELHFAKENRPIGTSLIAFKRGVMLCKLFQHTCFALTPIALAGDIESNPGYLTLDDIKTTRGLKIAHLKIRLFASRGNWQQDHWRTLSETWSDSSTSDAEIKLPGFVCVRQGRIGEKEGYGAVTIYIKEWH